MIPKRTTPGVYIQEAPTGVVVGVPTSVTAFVGRFLDGPTGVATQITSYAQMVTTFGGVDPQIPVTWAVRDFFTNGGTDAVIVRLGPDSGLQPADYDDPVTGYAAALRVQPFQLLCIPPDTFEMDEVAMATLYQGAAELCSRNQAFLIAEPPPSWSTLAASGTVDQIPGAARPYGIVTPFAQFAAVYFPPFLSTDPTDPTPRPVSGAIAGLYARTDAQVGVWKAPAGVDAGIEGAGDVAIKLGDADRGILNSVGINAIASFPQVGVVVWGARTLDGLDALGSDYKYVQVRRLTNYIETSIRVGTQWAVFEPNDAKLWSTLQLSVATFLEGLWQQGGLQGTSASNAYFVTCDASTTTPTDVQQGIVNIVVGFAPLYPAEFIVLYIQVTTATA